MEKTQFFHVHIRIQTKNAPYHAGAFIFCLYLDGLILFRTAKHYHQGQQYPTDYIPENAEQDIPYHLPRYFAKEVEVQHICHRMVKATEGEDHDRQDDTDRR